MKQRISPEDLKSLTPSQQEKLRAWWKPKQWDLLLHRESVLCVSYADNDLIKCANYYPIEKESTLPLLSIGQCIELLDENIDIINFMPGSYIIEHHPGKFESKELIDALFEAVKSIL